MPEHVEIQAEPDRSAVQRETDERSDGPDVTVTLDATPEALRAAAEYLGDLAARLWLDGKLDLS